MFLSENFWTGLPIVQTSTLLQIFGPLLKKNVEMHMPKDLSELEQYMAEEWDRIPNNVLINCIRSIRI